MEANSNCDIFEILQNARAQARNMASFYDVASVKRELRQRRKHLIGSFISLEEFLQSKCFDKMAFIEELSRYLALRTVYFWNKQNANAEEFCLRFYKLAICALTNGEVGDESIDDIIQLAECLVRSRTTFVTVMSEILPENMIGPMFYLVEKYDASYYEPSFEDAVLGAVSVFLGAIIDPVAQESANR